MRPVTKIATGLVIVFGALRFNGLDLLFDPVGWGMCAAGLLLLQRPGDAFARAQAAATAGALVTVWLIVDALMTRMRSRGDNSRVALLDVLRWAVAGLGAAGLLAGYGYAELSSVLVVGWFAALVVLTVVLYRLADRPYFAATRPASDGEVSSA
ncbi:hypothetical protein DMB42_45150 [Nonomuraea sp. WAC 01424]|uniref:hypothetical protein n=1 Tax=Nonomuraea sp. WAC 01424 TaxID=2203200 RepID=UPI000F78C409|nr:hypothetical protein [Nonomuraea sp. WAC 01424]RSM98196.1 hypothetical protein DMB42_45150 [Nonomuraea sp. WAC 01424]